MAYRGEWQQLIEDIGASAPPPIKWTGPPPKRSGEPDDQYMARLHAEWPDMLAADRQLVWERFRRMQLFAEHIGKPGAMNPDRVPADYKREENGDWTFMYLIILNYFAPFHPWFQVEYPNPKSRVGPYKEETKPVGPTKWTVDKKLQLLQAINAIKEGRPHLKSDRQAIALLQIERVSEFGRFSPDVLANVLSRTRSELKRVGANTAQTPPKK